MKHTRLNQQTNNQNIPNNLPITKSFNRSTKASQSITVTVPINQGTNVTLATQRREAIQPAKRLCSARGIILGCKQCCEAARNGGCRPNNLSCTLLHSQKDQWPGCVRQKPKDSLSRTDCALTSTEHKSHQNLLVYFGFRETQNSESHPSRKDF